MKRLFLTGLLCLVGVLASYKADAQCNFGIVGGGTFSSLQGMTSSDANYHAGITLRFDLPAGFSIQPSVLYNVKGAVFQGVTIDTLKDVDLSVGYLEMPVSFQWGPDLLLFRPFLDVSPYVGYGIDNSLRGIGGGESVMQLMELNDVWDSKGLSRWEYGVGLGVGLDIWKLQVIGRYNINFGSLTGGGLPFLDNKGNFRGFTISAAFLF